MREEPAAAEVEVVGRPSRNGNPLPIIPEEQVEDPVAKFIWTHRKELTLTVLAGLALFYVVHTFQENRRSRMAEAADMFHSVQEQFESFTQASVRLGEQRASTTVKPEDLKKQEEALTEQRARLDQSLRALADTDPPYTELAALYRGLLARSAGSASEAAGLLGGFSWRGESVDTSKRMHGELAQLAYARSLLDAEASREQGVALLKDLARDGVYVRVVAAVTLARIATSDAQRADAKALLTSIVQAQPEQSDLVKGELERLGR